MDSNNASLKKCNFCGEEIPAGTGRCPFCGSLLEVIVDEGTIRIPEEKPFGDMSGSGEALAAYNADTRDNTGKAPDSPGNAVNHPRPSWNSNTGFNQYKRPPLGNGLKVFLTVIFTMIPGLGQLAGIITAIVFMNTDDDPDRKSFGVAILVASLIMFVLACIGCFTIAVILSAYPSIGNLQY